MTTTETQEFQDFLGNTIREGDTVAFSLSNMPYVGVVKEVRRLRRVTHHWGGQGRNRMTAQVAFYDPYYSNRETTPHLRRFTKEFNSASIIRVAESTLSVENYSRLMQEVR